MSPFLQELVVFTGQNCVFEDGSDQLKKLAGVNVTAKQIERLSHVYGELLEIQTLSSSTPIQRDENLNYCMVDGGMVLTREDDWKELKLARIFKAEAHMSESEKRNFIHESTYTAHLGGHHPFFDKLAKQTDPLNNMVWICDGAKWIWNWIDSNYPESTQILDYFHCSEKLHDFAKEVYKNKEQRNTWTTQQEDLIKDGQIDVVIANIALTPCNTIKSKQRQRSILTYYENNQKRMNYKKFREEGLLVGSGPMEAAHRHVVQARMKLSGQRWTIKGAQQIVNLRVANKSKKWDSVIDLIQLN